MKRPWEEPGRGRSTWPSAGPGAMPKVSSPGKLTRTQLVSPPPAQLPARRPPPARVADATRDEAPLDAVLKVLVIDDGKVIQRWQSKARWDGPLPVRWAATRAGGGWKWDNPDAGSLKVQTDAHGRGGRSVDAWADPGADQIVVHVQPIEDVTIDEQAEPDTRAPGHESEPQDAGDGSTTGRPPDGGGAGAAQDEELASSEADDQLADDFERELGLDPEADRDDGDGDGNGDHDGRGDGEAGGDPEGRTGDDTRKGGTGPGGEAAKADGKGQGSDDGRSPGGSEGGSRDGKVGGAEEGMYGGKGEHGDRGVPSAIALFGGLLSVPAALRGFVELALILSSADLTGAGAQLFKQGLGKIASAAAARKMIASAARKTAVQELKAVIKRIATDRKTASAWAQATAEARQQATRIIYWELQRKYFKGYLDAAKQAKARARAALQKAPKSTDAQRSLGAAEMAEEAATVSPVAGRLPRNHEFAGKQFPRELLPAAYRKQGLRFTDTGFPDFEPFAKTLPNGKKYVEIQYMGSHARDFAAANAKAGYKNMPRGYTWHHSEELGRMYLVPADLHETVKHTGGVATYKHVTGDVKSYAK